MNIIVAVNEDWGIGFEGAQSVVIAEDRRYFKRVTDGGTVIVGRRTFESIGKPLPNRRNIVLTSNSGFEAEGVVVAHSVAEVFREVADDDPDRVFVIGGESVYRLFLPYCDYAFVTKIDVSPPSDAFFPVLDRMPYWAIARKSPAYEHVLPNGDVVRYSIVHYSKRVEERG